VNLLNCIKRNVEALGTTWYIYEVDSMHTVTGDFQTIVNKSMVLGATLEVTKEVQPMRN